MILVVGSTGVLGGEICRLLREKNQSVRALVRKTSDEAKVEKLRNIGCEITEGDLKDAESLLNACKNVDAIISTATTIRSAQPGDSFIDSDRGGHLQLIDTAVQQRVRRFVFISFPPMPADIPLQSAKRAVEDKLKSCGLVYTSLQPTMFQEVWLGPHVGFDLANGNVRIYGSGKKKISWISFLDVAQFAVRSLDTPETENKIIPLGGPQALSPLEVVALAEEVLGKKLNVEFVPEEALEAQHASAQNPVQKSFMGLMVSYAKGSEIDMSNALRMMPLSLRTVRDYLSSYK